MARRSGGRLKRQRRCQLLRAAAATALGPEAKVGCRDPSRLQTSDQSPASSDNHAALGAAAGSPEAAEPRWGSESVYVLVLGSHGYETAVNGKNGFVCFVQRSWAAGFDNPEFWNPRLRAPNCFNPQAARIELPQYLKRTEWVPAGATKQQLMGKARVAYANHTFRAPEAGAFSFHTARPRIGAPAREARPSSVKMTAL